MSTRLRADPHPVDLFERSASGLLSVFFADRGSAPGAAGQLVRVGARLQFHDGTAARNLTVALVGTLGALPAPGAPGRLYRATDAPLLFLDNTTEWLLAQPVDAAPRVAGLQGQPNSAAPTTRYELAATWVHLRNPTTRHTVVLPATTPVTVDLTVAGPAVNGRDQAAAFPANSWVRLYWISDGTTLGTIASLAGPTTGPTLPSGWPYWAYATTIRWSASSEIVNAAARGAQVTYANVVEVFNGTAASTDTTLSLTSVVPDEAVRVAVIGHAAVTSGATDGAVEFLLAHRTPVSAARQVMVMAYAIGGPRTHRAAGQGWIDLVTPQQIAYVATLIGSVGSHSEIIWVTAYRVPNGDT